MSATFGFVLWAVGVLLACGGGSAPTGTEAVRAEMTQALQPTVLPVAAVDAPPTIAPILPEEAGPPPTDPGDGLGILQVSPLGAERRALQAAVVFDRPMVALTDLDSMSSRVPIECTPAVPGKKRWAGTTTAVFVPDAGAFPRATELTCTVPAGTAALDGTTLENAVTWRFATERPRVVRSVPPAGNDQWDPNRPLVVLFNQPIEPDALRDAVKLVDQRTGDALAVELARPDGAEYADRVDRAVAIGAGMRRDTAYRLVIDAGVRGREGTLGSAFPTDVAFSTYPELRIRHALPTGTTNPIARLRLGFTTEVEMASVAAHVSLTPAPLDEWSPPTDYASTEWAYTLRLQPRTAYTLEVKPGIRDVHGQVLAAGGRWTFTTGDREPDLDGPTGLRVYAANNPPQIPFKHLNVRRLDAQIARVDPMKLVRADDWSEAANEALAAAHRVEVPTEDKPNWWEIDTVDISPMLEDGRGIVAVDISSPELRWPWADQPHHWQSLLVVTDLGTTLKVSPGAVDAWVTRLSDGKPVGGATVEFWQGGQKRASVITDAEGLARATGLPGTDWRYWASETRIWAVVRHGDDLSVAAHDFNDGIEPWQFGLWTQFEPTGRETTSFSFTDRGIYRLGDPAYVRVMFRLRTANGLELPLPGGKAAWKLVGPRGTEHGSGVLDLDKRGGADLSLTLPKEGDLGDYSVVVEGSGVGWGATEYATLSVRAYRPPAFRVDVTAAPEAVQGARLQAVLDARYLFGTPMEGAKVAWTTWKAPTTFLPAGWDGWTFGPEIAWWRADQPTDHGGVLASGTGRTDAQGRFVIEQAIAAGSIDRPWEVTLEGTVTDKDRQVIAGSADVLVHPAEIYVGLRPKQRLPEAGKAAQVEVAVVDTAGKAQRGVPVEVSVVERRWNRVREKGLDGRWTWVTTPIDTPVTTVTVRSADAPAPVSFTPTQPGMYVLTARATDAAGNTAVTTDSVYVVGGGFVAWAPSDDQRLELVADKAKYAPGETARVLVKTPREGLTALVTVEREGVLDRRIVELRGTAQTIEVPIRGEWRPNVFVTVIAVSGAGPQDAPDKGRPLVHVGMIELSVETDSERLGVAIRPDRDVYRPGDEVRVRVKVTQAGKPAVGAGVVLYAVDEAVLTLTAYETPDPHGRFYTDHGLSVLTADNRVLVLDRAAFLTKGAPPGGGGGVADASGQDGIRKTFVTTPLWVSGLLTDRDGVAEATFTLPDNLTAFRLMAVADAGATAFGSGAQEIRVTRPVLARPALPRFLRAGDTAFAGVVVHNNTDGERSVAVAAEAAGVTLRGGPVDVRVPAHGAVEVPFRIEATVPGTATFTFRVASGEDRDAVQVALPVQHRAPIEVVATSGSTTDRATERIARPDGAAPDAGGLEIELASTALVGAASGLDYLHDYPYGCVEQVLSQGVGSLVALQATPYTDVGVPEADLRRNVEVTTAKLRDFRHPSGGFAYWPGSRVPSVMGTAYAVEFMGRARAAGFPIEPVLLDEAIGFLREVLNGRHVAPGWGEDVSANARAYVAVALARAGAGDAGHNNRLYGQRAKLSSVGLASLLEAIARTTGPDGRTTELRRALEARMGIEAASASVREPDADRYEALWLSDDWATAATLEAFVTAFETHPLAPRLATHLASSRQAGRWHDTHATAASLSALVAYAQRYEGDGGPVGGALSLAGTELARASIGKGRVERVSVPMAQVSNGDLAVTAEGGRIYYEARLAYRPDVPKPRDEGFTLVRTLELVEGGGADGHVAAGALVRVTLRVVTPVERHFVAVTDRLPAGLEPLDTSLATSSRAPGLSDTGGGGADDTGFDAPLDYSGFWSTWVFNHTELRDDEVHLFADVMPAGVHTWQYFARATTPGVYVLPPATVEEMYEPEQFGRTAGGTFVVGPPAAVAAR